MQFRNTDRLFIQLSRYKCWGNPNSFAICFLRLLSAQLQYNFESVPKDDTSKVFHAGGYGGVSYLAKCSIKKSSFERFNSSFILKRHLEKIVVLENNDSSANQNAPQLDDTIWITLVRSEISMLCMAEKMKVRNSLSKLYKATSSQTYFWA